MKYIFSAAKRSLVRNQLDKLQKSYAEAFSLHGLTRIIYSGWKERVIWCLLLLGALIGLGFMSKEIVEQFRNKEVRTEVRIAQQESQKWPSITICSIAILTQYLNCYKNRNITEADTPNLCSKHFKLPDVHDHNENLRVDTKRGCVVYNLNGTLVQKGEIKKWLVIDYHDVNSGLPSNMIGIFVYFNDPQMVQNSSHSFYLQDLDMTYVEHEMLTPGIYEMLLQATEIDKLGPPYNSSCTKQKSINDKYHSRYSYKACMDRCAAMKMKRSCGVVLNWFRDYVTDEKQTKANNETIPCLLDVLDRYLSDNNFLSDCGCKQPCQQTLYEVTQKQVRQLTPESRWWRLKIRFKNKMMNSITEYPVYTTQELISQVGGTCGLFLGMSLLSLVEIFFHAMISLFKYCYFASLAKIDIQR